ncbi:MAG: hypothetical protein H7A38_06540 [Chlamydiales bacterium]|nr:hypothetical protein [Chlamydiales bacterium]
MKRTFPIEKGFQVVVFFLMDFWWKFLKDEMVKRGLINHKKMTPQERESASDEDKAKDNLLYDNGIVFTTILADPSGPGNSFKEVIRKKLGITPIDQSYGMLIDEDTLFQLSIDFCCYYNRGYQKKGKDPLRFAIVRLENMRKNPQLHEEEWNIWEKAIQYVNSPGDKHLIF